MGGKISVLSLGKKVSDTVLRKTLAAGADELILLQDDHFDKLDSHSTATALAGAIRKIGDYDLILTGRQAGDWDSGQVGLILGEMLGLPCISLAREISVEDGGVVVKKSLPEGYERVKAKMPRTGDREQRGGRAAVYFQNQDVENDEGVPFHSFMERG